MNTLEGLSSTFVQIREKFPLTVNETIRKRILIVGAIALSSLFIIKIIGFSTLSLLISITVNVVAMAILFFMKIEPKKDKKEVVTQTDTASESDDESEELSEQPVEMATPSAPPLPPGCFYPSPYPVALYSVPIPEDPLATKQGEQKYQPEPILPTEQPPPSNPPISDPKSPFPTCPAPFTLQSECCSVIFLSAGKLAPKADVSRWIFVNKKEEIFVSIDDKLGIEVEYKKDKKQKETKTFFLTIVGWLLDSEKRLVCKGKEWSWDAKELKLEGQSPEPFMLEGQKGKFKTLFFFTLVNQKVHKVSVKLS